MADQPRDARGRFLPKSAPIYDSLVSQTMLQAVERFNRAIAAQDIPGALVRLMTTAVSAATAMGILEGPLSDTPIYAQLKQEAEQTGKAWPVHTWLPRGPNFRLMWLDETQDFIQKEN
jgi:hypothetical protein